MLYEVAILERPTPKQEDEGELERIVVEPHYIVAEDSQSAAMSAVLDLEKGAVDRRRMQVLVRPFIEGE